MKKGLLKISTKFTEKHLCQSQYNILNQYTALRPATLLKKKLFHRCFPVNFAKFQGTPFYITPPDDCFCFLKFEF